jgi:hypothetical protein
MSAAATALMENVNIFQKICTEFTREEHMRKEKHTFQFALVRSKCKHKQSTQSNYGSDSHVIRLPSDARAEREQRSNYYLFSLSTYGAVNSRIKIKLKRAAGAVLPLVMMTEQSALKTDLRSLRAM